MRRQTILSIITLLLAIAGSARAGMTTEFTASMAAGVCPYAIPASIKETTADNATLASDDTVIADASALASTTSNTGTMNLSAANGKTAGDGLLTGINGPVTARYFGSYHHDVKSSDSDNFDGDPDAANTLTALADTGQNLFGYGVHTDREWGHFQTLVAEADAVGIEVFGVMAERHQESTTSYLENRWMDDYLRRYDVTADADGDTHIENFCFDRDGDASDNDPTTYETCYDRNSDELHDAWLASIKKAARTLSCLSLKYDNLTAFTVDDFDGAVCSPDGKLNADPSAGKDVSCYTRDEVRDITESAHAYNEEFKFWPTAYVSHMGRALVSGYTLGKTYANDDVSDGIELMYTGESANLTLSFSLSEADSYNSRLKFFLQDTTMSYGTNAALSAKVSVNGTTVFTRTADTARYFDYFNKSVGGYLKAGANKIKISLSAGSDVQYLTYYLDLWDIALTVNGADYTDQITFSTSTTEKKPDGTGYLLTGRSDASLIAKSNSAYRIGGTDDDGNTIVDGVLLTYHALDTYYKTDSEASALGAQKLYEKMLNSAQAALDGGELIMNHYAMLYGDADGDGTVEITPATIASGSLMEQIYIDSRNAAGIMLWDYPLGTGGRDDPKVGIYAPRAVEESMASNFDVVMSLPWYQPWVMGWYQSWTVPDLSGTVRVSLGEADAERGVYKEITAGDGTVLYREAMSTDECNDLTEGDTCPGADAGASCTIRDIDCSYTYNLKERLTIRLGDEPTELTIALRAEEAANIFGAKLYAKVRQVADASSGALTGLTSGGLSGVKESELADIAANARFTDADGDGFIDAYEFASGVEEDNIIRIFNCVKCAYNDLRGSLPAGYLLTDADGDGIYDRCIVPMTSSVIVMP